jgi:hypothetical protein
MNKPNRRRSRNLRRVGEITMWQPKTGATCYCRKGTQRDNCITCEGTGQRIDFKAIREHCKGIICKCNRLQFENLKPDDIIKEVKDYGN